MPYLDPKMKKAYMKKYMLRYVVRNPDYRSKACKNSSNLHKKIVSELRFSIFKKYGSRCIKCGFSDWRALQIDHVNGGGKKETKNLSRIHYYQKVLQDTENRYQILCANCNWIKRIEKSELNLLGK